MSARLILAIALAASMVILSVGVAWRLSHQVPIFELVHK